jgi:hypothetical protein
MKHWLILTQTLVLATACEQHQENTPQPEEPWSTEAEEVFQKAEVLKYEVEQQRLEAEKLRRQGLEGAPPGERQ